MNTPRVIDLTRHVDDRGDLAEVWRRSWDLIPEDDNIGLGEIAQVYTVFDPAAFTVRAYHRHERLWDLFHIASGSAKFHLVKGPEKFPTPQRGAVKEAGTEEMIVTLSSRKPQLLVVPPLYWHGWMSLEPGTLLVSLANYEYNRTRPDEERIPPDVFGNGIWKVEAK